MQKKRQKFWKQIRREQIDNFKKSKRKEFLMNNFQEKHDFNQSAQRQNFNHSSDLDQNKRSGNASEEEQQLYTVYENIIMNFKVNSEILNHEYHSNNNANHEYDSNNNANRSTLKMLQKQQQIQNYFQMLMQVIFSGISHMFRRHYAQLLSDILQYISSKWYLEQRKYRSMLYGGQEKRISLEQSSKEWYALHVFVYGRIFQLINPNNFIKIIGGILYQSTDITEELADKIVSMMSRMFRFTYLNQTLYEEIVANLYQSTAHSFNYTTNCFNHTSNTDQSPHRLYLDSLSTIIKVDVHSTIDRGYILTVLRNISTSENINVIQSIIQQHIFDDILQYMEDYGFTTHHRQTIFALYSNCIQEIVYFWIEKSIKSENLNQHRVQTDLEDLQTHKENSHAINHQSKSFQKQSYFSQKSTNLNEREQRENNNFLNFCYLQIFKEMVQESAFMEQSVYCMNLILMNINKNKESEWFQDNQIFETMEDTLQILLRNLISEQVYVERMNELFYTICDICEIIEIKNTFDKNHINIICVSSLLLIQMVRLMLNQFIIDIYQQKGNNNFKGTKQLYYCQGQDYQRQNMILVNQPIKKLRKVIRSCTIFVEKHVKMQYNGDVNSLVNCMFDLWCKEQFSDLQIRKQLTQFLSVSIELEDTFEYLVLGVYKEEFLAFLQNFQNTISYLSASTQAKNGRAEWLELINKVIMKLESEDRRLQVQVYLQEMKTEWSQLFLLIEKQVEICQDSSETEAHYIEEIYKHIKLMGIFAQK